MPDIGVVMPVYYQEPDFLKAALQSILDQTYTQFKLVIVIDGAPEMKGQAEVLTSGDTRVQLIENKENIGIARSLNRGFGELFQDPDIKYFTWVSSDNLYYPDFLETLHTRIEASPAETGLVHSSFRLINDDDECLQTEDELTAFRSYLDQPKENLLNACTISICFLYKKETAAKTGGYSMEPVEDYEYWLRLTEHCEISYVPVKLASYRVNSSHSISASLKSKQQHRRWRHAFHVARHEARQRRNIPISLTILFPLQHADESAAKRLEDLYEQLYSNYQVFILDLSEDTQPSRTLLTIPQPMIMAAYFPGKTPNETVVEFMDKVTTPYFMILDKNPFSHNSILEILMKNLIKHEKNPAIVSAAFDENKTAVILDIEFSGQLEQGKIYRTEKIKAWMGRQSEELE
ncbi:glycosyltransferase [Bacillus mangrovi]|uniref:Glycosyltransferase n=1 Tax=Metabacillus mangrovi TaxID=1491830 RepID=A0A7X2V618_9BACI|nr:glycosyltransferase family 2 protein [Metabacillus mangrovi]MTH55020.1 glycosyltransferase [Metabacillus mangrovi]